MVHTISILYIPSKFTAFFLPKPATGHSRIVSFQRNLATPASVLPAPLVSSPSLDANGGTDLLMIRSPDCSPSRLPRVNQMWTGESKEFQVMKGC